MDNLYTIENGANCSCGKAHVMPVKDIIVEKGAINLLPSLLNKYSCKKPFVIFDKNTYEVAGKKVLEILDKNSISYSSYKFNENN